MPDVRTSVWFFHSRKSNLRNQNATFCFSLPTNDFVCWANALIKPKWVGLRCITVSHCGWMEWGGVSQYRFISPDMAHWKRERGGGHFGSNKSVICCILSCQLISPTWMILCVIPWIAKAYSARNSWMILDLQYLSLAMHVKTAQGIASLVFHSILH